MVDKIKKALDRFTKKEKDKIKNVLLDIRKLDIVKYDVKKLRGHKDIFRLRKGKVRIIYRIKEDQKVQLITVEKRSDTTYNL